MKTSRSLSMLLRHGSYWLLVYTLLWVLLSGATGLWFGLAYALAAAGLSLWLKLPPLGLRLLYLPRFLVFFLYETLLGAWDVAKRAFDPQLPIDPAWVTYSFHSADPRVRLLLSAMVGLMPGTLATHGDEAMLYLHILDKGQDWLTPVAQMEAQLARLLGGTSA